ncbi:MAG: class I SAM-dependent methyltransferase [Methanomassiliicoccaceae archaeon]|nr:class I SAM-dependent methyltransferase [Methanomassiliicoccaceae archaeon]
MHTDRGHTLFKKPVGEEGRSLLEEMNRHHRKLSEWALSKLPMKECKKILDIGCGGGMLISLLNERFANAEIYGIDISEESVDMAKKVNSDIVGEGRCHITLDSVSDIPFEDGSFDLVTAFETYFFWPDLRSDLKEAASKVKKGGYIVIVSETYPHPNFRERNDEAVRLYGLNLVDNDLMEEMLEGCGTDVIVNEDEEKNWVAFIGTKR